MKIRFCAALLLAALAFTIFTGCSVHALQQLDAVEKALDRRIDMAEDAIEHRIESSFEDNAVPKASAPAAAPNQSAAKQITKEDSISIALNHAGLTEDQVTHLRVDFDYDQGNAEYEVEFYYSGYEYDYDIHAETGEILFWDKDRED